MKVKVDWDGVGRVLTWLAVGALALGTAWYFVEKDRRDKAWKAQLEKEKDELMEKHREATREAIELLERHNARQRNR